MSEAPNRDPFAFVLQFLILAVLAWIAIGISNLATIAPELGPSHKEQMERTLAALDRTLDVLTMSAGRHDRPTAAFTPLSAEDAPDETDAAGAVRALAPIRMKLARPVPAALHADGGGPLFDLGERVTAKAALAIWHDLHNRLRTGGHDAQRRVRQEYLLMDRAAVLLRFGRPDYIGESKNGASEQWSYRLGDESIQFTIRGGYVINIY